MPWENWQVKKLQASFKIKLGRMRRRAEKAEHERDVAKEALEAERSCNPLNRPCADVEDFYNES